MKKQEQDIRNCHYCGEQFCACCTEDRQNEDGYSFCSSECLTDWRADALVAAREQTWAANTNAGQGR